MALTTKQGYPQYRTDRNGLTLVEITYGSWTDVLAYEEMVGTQHLEYPQYCLDSMVKKRLESGTLGEIEKIYTRAESVFVGIDTNRPEPSCQVSLFEKPLEQHPDYRNKWNYHLACRNDAASETPSWYADSGKAGGTFFDTGGSPSTYRWIKEMSDMPQEDGYTWKMIYTKTKPGVESFYYPATTVNEKLYFTDYAAASAASANAGMIETPNYTFGRTGGEWLNMGASVYKDGRKWVVDTNWQFSPNNGSGEGWDHDLYAAVT